jgi:hypothetical protein
MLLLSLSLQNERKKEIEKKIQSRLIHFMVSWVSKGQLISEFSKKNNEEFEEFLP